MEKQLPHSPACLGWGAVCLFLVLGCGSVLWLVFAVGSIALVGLSYRFVDWSSLSWDAVRSSTRCSLWHHPRRDSPYGRFPLPGDVFQFMPCTNLTTPPLLEDPNPNRSWRQLFDPNPTHWSWGNKTGDTNATDSDDDPFAGRGIYLC